MAAHLTLTFLLLIQMFATFDFINRNNKANSKPNPFWHSALSTSTRSATLAPPTVMRRQTQLELLVTAVGDAPYASTCQNVQQAGSRKLPRWVVKETMFWSGDHVQGLIQPDSRIGLRALRLCAVKGPHTGVEFGRRSCNLEAVLFQ